MSSEPVRGVAAEVRAHAARKDISQTDLAVAIGISQSSMSRRLAGEYPFTVAELYRLADLFGVDAAVLLPARASA